MMEPISLFVYGSIVYLQWRIRKIVYELIADCIYIIPGEQPCSAKVKTVKTPYCAQENPNKMHFQTN